MVVSIVSIQQCGVPSDTEPFQPVALRILLQTTPNQRLSQGVRGVRISFGPPLYQRSSKPNGGLARRQQSHDVAPALRTPYYHT
jgi:hypothetical protein